MSTYGDAFAITPQRSLPREKAAEMLERISQLNEEYEERKEIEDQPCLPAAAGCSGAAWRRSM